MTEFAPGATVRHVQNDAIGTVRGPTKLGSLLRVHFDAFPHATDPHAPPMRDVVLKIDPDKLEPMDVRIVKRTIAANATTPELRIKLVSMHPRTMGWDVLVWREKDREYHLAGFVERDGRRWRASDRRNVPAGSYPTRNDAAALVAASALRDLDREEA